MCQYCYITWKQFDSFRSHFLLFLPGTRAAFALGLIFLCDSVKAHLHLLSNVPWIMRFSTLALGTGTIPGHMWILGSFLYFFSDGSFHDCEHFPCMHILVKTQLNIQGGTLKISRSFSLCKYPFSGILPVNSSCLGLSGFSTPPST